MRLRDWTRKRNPTRWTSAAMTVLALLFAATTALGQAGGQRYAVLIGGLGGSEEYTTAYRTYLFETRQAFIESFGVPAENVIVLGETKISDLDFVTDVSTAENIRAQFAGLASKVTPDDHVYVILFGHGSYDGTNALLNIPRRDLTDADYAALLDELPAGQVIFINTASASGPFIEALSASDRIVITATKSGTQRNETIFPQYFIEALTSPEADLDKNGDLSVREVFDYASGLTDRRYEENRNLATEFALLDDTGDRQGYRSEELEQQAEGNLAAVTYLKRSLAPLIAAATPDASENAASGNEAALPLLREKESVEREIASQKARKGTIPDDLYYDELEFLFLRLARVNDQIETLLDQ